MKGLVYRLQSGGGGGERESKWEGRLALATQG